MKNPAVICDLDGTLASCAWRTHFVDLDEHVLPDIEPEGLGYQLICPACGQDWPCETNKSGKKDWNAFFDRLSCDAPVPAVRTLLNYLRDVDLDVVIVSGRPSDRRYQTEWWLGEHEITYSALFMRSQGDQRRDDIVKKELFESHVAPAWDVKLVIDDRQIVVDQWRELGLPVIQVVDPGLDPLLAGPSPKAK